MAAKLTRFHLAPLFLLDDVIDIFIDLLQGPIMLENFFICRNQ